MWMRDTNDLLLYGPIPDRLNGWTEGELEKRQKASLSQIFSLHDDD